MYYRSYEHRKTWLEKYLKSPISDNPLTDNLVNGPKHCFNLNHSTFAVFIDCSEGN